MTTMSEKAQTNGSGPSKDHNPAPAPSGRIEIDDIVQKTMFVPIVGITPLIVHNFSEKSKRQMLDSMQGIKTPKKNRDPEADYESGFYRMSGRDDTEYGFPVLAFKAATVGAARFYGKDVKMTELKQFMFMKGIITPADPQMLVPIFGSPKMREDVVRLSGVTRSADLRYRPEFAEWSTVLEVTFVEQCISMKSVLSLINAGGMGIGVGEWRPERKGENGKYQIDMDKGIEVVE
jgi:hypothetical protein